MGWFHDKRYAKYDGDFSKCKTIAQLEKAGSEAYKKSRRGRVYLSVAEIALVSLPEVVNIFQTGNITDFDLSDPRLQMVFRTYADKFGHVAKGFLASYIGTRFFEGLNKKLVPPQDADDEIKNSTNYIVEKSLIETGSFAGSAMGWELLWYAARDNPVSINDMGADAIGHGLNMFNGIVYTVNDLAMLEALVDNQNRIRHEHKILKATKAGITGSRAALLASARLSEIENDANTATLDDVIA